MNSSVQNPLNGRISLKKTWLLMNEGRIFLLVLLTENLPDFQ